LAIVAGVVAAAILAVGYATPIGGYVIYGPSVAAGLGAKLACSGVFVSGRSFHDVTDDDVARSLPMPSLVHYSLDATHKSVSATALGLVARTAVYRPGIGCTLLVASDPSALAQQARGVAAAADSTRAAPWPGGDEVDLTGVPSAWIARHSIAR
jgi:hypothetical protein